MTKRMARVLFAAALAVAISAPLAAQSTHLAVNVPFEFNIHSTVLPAGEYLFQRGGDGSLIVLRSLDGMAGAVVLTTSGRTSEKESGAAALTFHRYGDSYFLSSIRNGFTGIANTVPATRREEELRRTATEQKFEVTAYLARR